ncbi:MAG: hypothetical protein IKO04_05690 [Bacteroidales bacterium]|nr:hypothetical protein [Bacteroidales bacterium]
MKKFYYVAVLALVASAACTKTELSDTATPDVKIGYQVANYMAQTKAGETSFLTELSGLGVAAANAAFKSSAFLNADNGNGGHNFGAFYPTNPETISWNTSTTEWEPSRDYYWPKSPKSNIDFFSWYVYGVDDPILTYDGTDATMVWEDKTIPSKADILFANVAFHQQKNSETYKLDGVTEGVPTLFHHGLAQVKFTLKIKDGCDKKADSKNSGKYTFWEVKLSDFAIAANKIHSNGTLTLSVEDPDANDTAASITSWGSAAWTNAATPAYVATNTAWFTTNAAKGTDALTTTVANAIPNDFMGDGYVAVRPQTIGNDVTLGFKMTIVTKYGTELASATTVNTEVIDVASYDGTPYDTNNIYTATGIQLNKIGASPITEWEMNHKYVYNIVIDPSTTTILYDPAVEAWAAETSVSQEVPGTV